ncbi:hypothetical protein V2J09_018073, partial [Rumex salicifolius]
PPISSAFSIPFLCFQFPNSSSFNPSLTNSQNHLFPSIFTNKTRTCLRSLLWCLCSIASVRNYLFVQLSSSCKPESPGYFRRKNIATSAHLRDRIRVSPSPCHLVPRRSRHFCGVEVGIGFVPFRFLRRTTMNSKTFGFSCV